MVDNAFVTQGLYLGVEATRGVAVPATRRVIGFDLTSKIDATATEFRPLGSKFVTVDALQEEWTSGTIAGAVCYTELPYLLSSVMRQSPAPVQQMDGATATGAYKWVFDSNAFDADNPITYTVEQGNSARARRFTYMMLTDYSLSIARNAVTHTGTVMAQQHQDNVNLTTLSLAAPVLGVPVASAAGGTFAAGTYFFQVSAINAAGETLPSVEARAATTGATGSVVLTWAAVTGATGYRVYRAATSGAESVTPALVAAVGAVTTYTDTGSVTTAGAALTGNPTAAPAAPLPSTSLTPVLASQVDVFVDPTFAALGTTRQSRIFKVDPNIGSRYKPVWPLDSSKPSWAAHVEAANTATCNFTASYDQQGAAFLGQLRVGSTVFMRVRALGQAIYNGAITVNHSLTIDMAVKIKQADAFSDTDGVFAIGYGTDIVYDGGWGKALHVEVVSSLAAL